jgi:hypothetical protein
MASFVNCQPISLGWFPVELKLRPLLPAIRWVEFGETRLSDPFFHQTVKKLCANQHTLGKISNFEFILMLAECIESKNPCCFIFHLSRCGSTLLANAFKAVDSLTVVSEAQPITTLFAPYDPRRWPYAPDCWERHRNMLLQAVIKVFGQRRGGKEKSLVVKFTSWNMLFLSLVRSLWPTVPCLLVVRDPLQIMLSNLRSPSGWMTRKTMPSFCCQLFGWTELELNKMTNEEYCARVIGKLCSAATLALDDQCIVIDYENIDAEKLCELVSVSGIRLTSSEREAVFSATHAYSKDIGRPFTNDQKMFAPSQRMKEASVRWANREYDQLLEAARPPARRRGQRG